MNTIRFDFATAGRIVFGPGAILQAAPAARGMGQRALVVTGSSPSRAAEFLEQLKASGVQTVLFSVAGEPEVDMVREAVQRGRGERVELVIGFGGGSAIDAGKAVAALLTNSGEPLDYLEVVGRGGTLSRPSLPFIAIPTTAGTGSEVTRNAVLASSAHKVKASLRSPYMLPRLAVVDPELSLELPKELTASTGLDALTQLIEPYVSVRANAMTDMYCLEGMRRAAASLARAWEDGSDLSARTDMAWASLLGGLSLANAALGAVHGFAAPVGGMFDAPHGAVCAALLPHVMRMNLRALHARAPHSQALGRYQTIAVIVTGDPEAAAEDGVEWVAALCRNLQTPPLRTFGISESDAAELVEKASKASSMKGNPIPLTPEELNEILRNAL